MTTKAKIMVDELLSTIKIITDDYKSSEQIAIDNLNKNIDLREKMIGYIVNHRMAVANGKRVSDRQYDALEKRISDKSFVQLKKEYDALKENSSFGEK